MKSRSKTVLGVAAVIVAILVAFAFWYRATYSMGVAHSFDVEGSVPGPRILIASQGSAFKDAVVAGVVERMRERKATVSVIDVSQLGTVNEESWDAIVLIHTWEMRKPPAEVDAFVHRVRNKHRLVVLTTSGDGAFRLEGVDAISSASRYEDVPATVAEIAERVEAVLNAAASAGSGSGP